MIRNHATPTNCSKTYLSLVKYKLINRCWILWGEQAIPYSIKQVDLWNQEKIDKSIVKLYTKTSSTVYLNKPIDN
jgi:hypothetical protein